MLPRLMMEHAEGLGAAWCERANGNPVVTGLFQGPVDPGLVHTLLREFAEVLSVGEEALPQDSPEWTVLECTVNGDPRCEAAAWIELFASGREVIEEFLVENAVERLGSCEACMEDLLDDLEIAFRLLVHKRLQCLCEHCLSVMEYGGRQAACA